MMTSETKKFVIVGDARVGKSTLMKSWKLGCFYEYPVFPGHANVIRTTQAVWETKGAFEIIRFLEFLYSDAKVILICYSVDSRLSLINVFNVWKPQVEQFSPQVLIILVGIKADDKTQKIVSTAEGEAAKKKIRASALFECSSVTMQNVNQIFEAAAAVSLKNNERLSF